MLGTTAGAGVLLGSATQTSASAADEIPGAEYVAAAPQNYTEVSRLKKNVNYVVIHTLEGPYEPNIRFFERPNDRGVSSHFVVGKEPGQITQMVDIEDVAHTQGEAAYNYNGVSIEMEGSATEDAHTDALYENTAAVTRYVCEEWGIDTVHPEGIMPCDGSGEGIIGHDQVPEIHTGNCDQPTDGKIDPGPYWEWSRLMDLVRTDTFETGDIVATRGPTNVRANADVQSELFVTFEEDTYGEIIKGPVRTDSYTFWKVEYNSETGWSIERRLESRDPTFSPEESVETTMEANVREEPKIERNVKFTFKAGETGTITGYPHDAAGFTFYPVDFESVAGWVPESRLGSPSRFDRGQTVHVTADELAVRYDAGLSQDLLRSQPQYTTGTVVGGPKDQGEITWWQIEYDDDYADTQAKTTGWSSGNYLEAGTPGRVEGLAVDDTVQVVDVDSLAVRPEPGKDNGPRGSASQGTTGTIVDGPRYVGRLHWWKIDYGDVTGWSSAYYLERSTATAEVSSTNPGSGPFDWLFDPTASFPGNRSE
jgi:N-acetyl-anhydromuramyl-L-alanine amidase AmpD